MSPVIEATKMDQSMNMDDFLQSEEIRGKVESISQLLSRSNISRAEVGGLYRRLRIREIRSCSLGQYAGAVGFNVETLVEAINDRKYKTDLENYDSTSNVPDYKSGKVPCPHCFLQTRFDQFNVDLEICKDEAHLIY